MSDDCDFEADVESVVGAKSGKFASMPMMYVVFAGLVAGFFIYLLIVGVPDMIEHGYKMNNVSSSDLVSVYSFTRS